MNHLPGSDIQFSRFAVNETPRCVWDWEMQKKNERFIKSIDPNYFAYQAELHYSQLDGENKDHAALALRSAYIHALESFMSLLGATLQAPDCIYGWLGVYETKNCAK